MVALYAIWQHTHTMEGTDAWVYLRGSAIVFILSLGAQLTRIVFRNLAIGRKCTKLTLHIYGENVARLTLTLPRPWAVQAGERVELSAPSVGLFYLPQSHPFAICWWEDNGTGKAVSVSLLFRPRSGFTRKILGRLEQEREYTAWFDGPFGPASIGSCGSSGQMGNYGHVFMVATGIGIAAQLPYIKEILTQYRRARLRTQRISLVWQLEHEEDWEAVHDWLQILVKQDEGYVSHFIPSNTFADTVIVTKRHNLRCTKYISKGEPAASRVS
jgi:NAD(P)H-flavin reductase